MNSRTALEPRSGTGSAERLVYLGNLWEGKWHIYTPYDVMLYTVLQAHVDTRSGSSMFELLRKRLCLSSSYSHLLSILKHLLMLPSEYVNLVLMHTFLMDGGFRPISDQIIAFYPQKTETLRTSVVSATSRSIQRYNVLGTHRQTDTASMSAAEGWE